MNETLTGVDVEARNPTNPRSERLFYGGMAALILVAVSTGFARSYYLRGAIAAPPFPLARLTPVIHMHAILFTGWILLLMAQTSLVTSGRRDLHRRLGMVATIWVPLMIMIGTMAALLGVVRGTAPPFMEPRRWLAVQAFDLLVFGGAITAGLLARRAPQTHKRWMLVATIALLPPALGRSPLPAAVFRMGVPGIFGLADLALVPLIIWDLATRGRIHRRSHRPPVPARHFGSNARPPEDPSPIGNRLHLPPRCRASQRARSRTPTVRKRMSAPCQDHRAAHAMQRPVLF